MVHDSSFIKGIRLEFRLEKLNFSLDFVKLDLFCEMRVGYNKTYTEFLLYIEIVQSKYTL